MKEEQSGLLPPIKVLPSRRVMMGDASSGELPLSPARKAAVRNETPVGDHEEGAPRRKNSSVRNQSTVGSSETMVAPREVPAFAAAPHHPHHHHHHPHDPPAGGKLRHEDSTKTKHRHAHAPLEMEAASHRSHATTRGELPHPLYEGPPSLPGMPSVHQFPPKVLPPGWGLPQGDANIDDDADLPPPPVDDDPVDWVEDYRKEAPVKRRVAKKSKRKDGDPKKTARTCAVL